MNAPSPARLLYLSAGPARNTTSGALLMHRHFALLSRRFELHSAHEAPPLPGETNYTHLPRRRLFQRLLRTRFSDLVHALDYRNGLFHFPGPLRETVRRVRPHAILTVAESSIYHAARRIARAERVPLVSIYHDWSPGWPHIARWARPGTERAFRRTYRESAFAFCISEEMRAELGESHRSAVLLPIPEPQPVPAAPAPDGEPFFALYAGTFSHLYAPEMQALCRALRPSAQPMFRVIGPDPGWAPAETRLLQESGVYGGFHKGPELSTRLRRAAALVVISPFGPDYEAYSRYSFPSKIPEYCRYGRPIVIWGPANAASVRWARRSAAALVVDSPRAEDFLQALRELVHQPERRQQFAERAGAAARSEFAPERLQSIFEAGLDHAIVPRGVPSP